MPEMQHLSVRVPIEKKVMLRKEAEKFNMTISNRLNDILERHFEPLPDPVESTIIDLSKKLGVCINEVISFCVINTVARLDAELQALGKPLLNCFLVQRDADWTEIYQSFKKEYLGNLYAGEAGFAAQEKWTQTQRAKYQKTLADLKKKAAQKRAQEQAEKSEDQE